MFNDRQRGAILVASLIILALLSLLGAGGLLNATLDTQLAYNRSVSGEAFYAAEAGLDAGVGEVYTTVQDTLRPYDPVAGGVTTWTTPAKPAAVNFDDINGYKVEYQINYAGALTPGGEPKAYQFSAMQSGQVLESDAYTYLVQSRAVGPDGTSEAMSETLQVLETPLVQYFVFFDKDLGWHPGETMTSWGRIHTNGDLGFANTQPVTFRDTDAGGSSVPCTITASGAIRHSGHLWADGSWHVRAPNTITVNAGGISEAINVTIDGLNQSAQELRFRDGGGNYHVRVGVDRMPSATSQSLARGDFYEQQATTPRKQNIDGMVIHADAGLSVRFNPFDGPATNVTTMIQDYQVSGGVPVGIDNWSLGARTNADGTIASSAANAPAPKSIVYAVGNDRVDEDDGGGGSWTDDIGANANPRYPTVLERMDGRENKEVELLVIDVQRLQEWYRDYLDEADDGDMTNNSVDLNKRRLLIYASLTNAAAATGGRLQAVKLIGSRAGRTRGDPAAGFPVDRQADGIAANRTLVVPTTIATDNPVYVEGDFNAPAHDGTVAKRGAGAVGCAIVCDALTLLSNEWGNDHWLDAQNAGARAHVTRATTTTTAFNAAFFTGRYDFETNPAGSTAEEAGIHNFPHFLEDWQANTWCVINGCLINLWFSTQSPAPHGGGYYGAPDRAFGWDRGFMSRSYWPPYVPSIYSVERTAWRED